MSTTFTGFRALLPGVYSISLYNDTSKHREALHECAQANSTRICIL